MSEERPIDRSAVIGMITACWKTQVIGEGVRRGIFEALAEEPDTAGALATASGVDADGMMRLLRALTVLGLLDQTGPDRFVLAPAGRYLTRDAADSLSGMAMHWSERIWESFANLRNSVETGEASVPSGPEHFAESQADPVRSDIFNRAMAEGSLIVGRALAKAHDFSRYRTVMDVGGGYGALLVGLVEANPGLHGFVFDMPVLANAARRYLAEQGVDDRVDYVGGSFFETVPAKADCLLLKFILHDWNDEKSIRILANCKAAVGKGSLFVIERIIPEIVGPKDAAVIQGDLVMMSVGGKERTAAEYRALFAQAGLKLDRIIPTETDFSIIECSAADL